jgi:putative ABC transport system substrate-binding protein
MKAKILVYALPALILATVHLVEAQQPDRTARIGYLDDGTTTTNVELLNPFRQQMSKLGWTEGKNLTIEYRFGEGKGPGRLSELAVDLVHSKVDLLVVSATSAALAARNATSIIPIVMASVGDPVGQGLIASLARPGGNITGLASLAGELGGKRLEILKEAIPRSTTVAVFMGSDKGRGGALQAKIMNAAAPTLGLRLEVFRVTGDPERLDKAFQAATRERFHAFITTSGPAIFAERRRIVTLAGKYRLPGIFPEKEFVEEGGLMSYGVHRLDQYRRAAYYVDKILKGAKPADLPVEQPTKFEFVINLKAAKQIGLTIPQWTLTKADKVIR